MVVVTSFDPFWIVWDTLLGNEHCPYQTIATAGGFFSLMQEKPWEARCLKKRKIIAVEDR